MTHEQCLALQELLLIRERELFGDLAEKKRSAELAKICATCEMNPKNKGLTGWSKSSSAYR